MLFDALARFELTDCLSATPAVVLDLREVSLRLYGGWIFS